MTGFMGRDHTFVIAEIGSNWAANVDAALALIDAAADAGADAAKFQAGHADHVYDPAQFPDEHASFKKWIEPTLDVLPILAKHCEERGIDFGCSAFCLDALDAVDPYVKWHKVASGENDWGPFLDAVGAKGKPVLLSAGRINLHLFCAALTHIPTETVPLHCVMAYPASLEDTNLRSHFQMFGTWGLSDHTTHPTIAPAAAVALGASVIEKHLRLDDAEWIGDTGWLGIRHRAPDHGHSLDPAQFRQMVEAIRLTEKALGSSEKRIRPSEEKYLKYRRGKRGLRGA